jgi:hypothetical protein
MSPEFDRADFPDPERIECNWPWVKPTENEITSIPTPTGLNRNLWLAFHALMVLTISPGIADYSLI